MRSVKHLREVLEVIIIGQLCGSDMVYQGAKGDPFINAMHTWIIIFTVLGYSRGSIIVTCILIMG